MRWKGLDGEKGGPRFYSKHIYEGRVDGDNWILYNSEGEEQTISKHAQLDEFIEIGRGEWSRAIV